MYEKVCPPPNLDQCNPTPECMVNGSDAMAADNECLVLIWYTQSNEGCSSG